MYIVIIFFLATFISFSQDRLNSLLEDNWSQPVDMIVDVQHINLNLKIEPYLQKIEGYQILTFKTLRQKTDSLIFYSPEMDFINVQINNRPQKFFKRGIEHIVIVESDLEYNKSYELVIEFYGNPTEGLYFSGWDDTTNRHRKQIWAHSPQGWMPFINQKHDLLTSEIKLSFDNKFKVFSNGDRILEHDNKDGTKTWHYKIEKPHVIYLVCLAIGEYDIKYTKSAKGTPMELWYYPDQSEYFNSTYIYSEYMIDFFEKEIGIDYPWSVYRQAPMVNYMYGGMETTTATVFGDYMHIPPRAWWMRNYVNVNSHELNHQWFGNYLSHLNNRHTWLTESFATYYAKLFEKDIFGEDYYQWEREKELNRVFNAAKVNNNPVSHSQAGTDRWYPKGSLVLDMMRDVLGDTLFHYSFKYYSKKYAHQVVETNDLLKSIREKTGVALDWFFDQWILRGGEPHFKIEYKSNAQNSQNNQVTIVDIEQIHKVDNLIKYFRVPANIHIYYADGSVDSVKKWISGQKSIIYVPNPMGKKIKFVIFDPNRKIIKKVSYQRNAQELLAQAEFAKNMIDRFDALIELKNVDLTQKRETYKRIFSKEKFHLNKSEIIKQLSNDSLSFDLIKQAIKDSDTWVRRAVVESLKVVPKTLKNDYLVLLKDTCFINVELALRNLASSFPKDDFLTLTKDEIGWRGKNIRMAWLEISMLRNFNEKDFDELVDYTSKSYEFETRINSFDVAKNLNFLDERIISNALDAYLHWNFKLRDGAWVYLKYVHSQFRGRILIDKIINESSYSVKQKTKIQSLLSRLELP